MAELTVEPEERALDFPLEEYLARLERAQRLMGERGLAALLVSQAENVAYLTGYQSWLRVLKKGDLVFFYHSGEEKQIVGLARVEKAAYPDPTAKEGDWSAVDIVAVKPLSKPVTLRQIKADKTLTDMPLVRQSRLSVSPVTKQQFERILSLA